MRWEPLPYPLPPSEGWRFRWCVTKSWNRLHRVVSGTLKRDDFVGFRFGKTACGLTGDLQMPGVLSRMGLERCAKCCKAAGIPKGRGAPFNSLRGSKREA